MGRTADSTSSTEKSGRVLAPAPDGVVLGRVVGVHGLRGELRVRLLDEHDRNLRVAPRVRLAERQGDPKAVEARVRAVGKGRRGEARLSLEGLDDRDTAESHVGRVVLGDAEHLVPLETGEFYQYELVGCRVEDGNGATLGTVHGFWETGAPDVMLVRDDSGHEVLIPAAESWLREVDVLEKRLRVELPDGLLSAAEEDATDGD
ncbi:MAG: ribosome maturation factor RimM [Myxococcota bacterium]